MMLDNFKKIVCPVDFSESSKLSAKVASKLASLSEGKVALVHIILNADSDFYRTEQREVVSPAKAEERAEEMLREFAKENLDTVDCDFFVECEGLPGRSVPNFARFYGADMIVMAKKEGFSRLSTGGFAGSVIKRAHCSLLLLRSGELSEEGILDDKRVLVVDDELDVLETVSEILGMCRLHTASDYDTALKYLQKYMYDVVILDIMGVNGFDLLEKCVKRGFPAVMFSSHAVTPEAIKKSMRLGAVFFLPKERITDIKAFLEEIVIGDGKSIWNSFFEKLDMYFEKILGQDWEATKILLKDIQKEMGNSE
ncbi:MAG: universal stress protein [Deltaproteobacteria bacterium]|nr:universal stress protein [Deltaproteobacteria bacterium]